MTLLKSAHGGNIREAAALLGITEQQIVDFSANINPLGMPDSLKHALGDNLQLAQRYPDVEYSQLHAALAHHHQIPPSWLLAGNGETESLFTLVNALKPRRAMLVIPGFAEYRRALRNIDCTIVEFALQEATGWQLNESLLPALTPDLDCLFLCTPNNPTGLLPPPELITAIATRCRDNGITLIVDEAFIDFIPDEPGLIPLLAQNRHIWVLRSLTKFYAIPGLRLGYLVNSDPQAIALLREQQMPWSVNAFAALAGERVLSDVAYQQATWQWLTDEGPRFYQALSQFTGLTVYPGRANYLFLHCDWPVDLQQALLAHHILIRSCANYPGLTAGYFRVAIRSHEENQRLIMALQHIAAENINHRAGS